MFVCLQKMPNNGVMSEAELCVHCVSGHPKQWLQYYWACDFTALLGTFMGTDNHQNLIRPRCPIIKPTRLNNNLFITKENIKKWTFKKNDYTCSKRCTRVALSVDENSFTTHGTIFFWYSSLLNCFPSCMKKDWQKCKDPKFVQ